MPSETLIGVGEMKSRATPSFGSQFPVLLKRHLLLRLRDPLLYAGRILTYLFFLTFIAVLYHKARDRSNERLQFQVFAIYWIVSVPSLFCIIGCFSYNQEVKTVQQEVKNKLVNLSAYLAANFVIKLIAILPLTLACMGIPLYAILNGHLASFFPILLLLYLTFLHYEVVNETLGAFFANPLIGMLIGMQYVFSGNLFCGLFLAQDQVFWPMRVFSYICPLKYCFEATYYKWFHGLTYSGATTEGCETYTADNSCNYHFDDGTPQLPGWQCSPDTNPVTCYGQTGGQILDSLHGLYDCLSDDNHFGRNVLILVGFCLYFQFVFMLVVHKVTTKHSVIKSEESSNQGSSYQNIMEQDHSRF